MNYTNKQLIAICRKAKKNLWNGKRTYWASNKSKYVCSAINTATGQLYGVYERPQKLQKLVKAHIGNHHYLHDFLRRKLGEKLFNTATPQQIQAWRFLMLDSIIKMLKEEGNK